MTKSGLVVLVYGVVRGGECSHFDSGAFLSDSSLGIWAGNVFRLSVA